MSDATSARRSRPVLALSLTPVGPERDASGRITAWAKRDRRERYAQVLPTERPVPVRGRLRGVAGQGGTTDIANLVLEYELPARGQGNDTRYLPKLQHPPSNAPELPITISLTVGETVSVSSRKSHYPHHLPAVNGKGYRWAPDICTSGGWSGVAMPVQRLRLQGEVMGRPSRTRVAQR
jgi:hypothetical protein